MQIYLLIKWLEFFYLSIYLIFVHMSLYFWGSRSSGDVCAVQDRNTTRAAGSILWLLLILCISGGASLNVWHHPSLWECEAYGEEPSHSRTESDWKSLPWTQTISEPWVMLGPPELTPSTTGSSALNNNTNNNNDNDHNNNILDLYRDFP